MNKPAATTLEPAGKLDTMATVTVNGPMGEALDWDAIDWRSVEHNVQRLRQRIFTATRAGDLAKVRNLQKLLLRSLSNTLISVRQATERNAGRTTPGVDGVVALTAQARARLVAHTHHQATPWQARPVKRVFIPKANGKQRPLGIPVMIDRVLQARVRNALEPEWEARFEPRSYGFRPGRGCQDAIIAIHNTVNGVNAKRRWVLDADLAAAFDRIDHEFLLEAVGGFPARGLLRQWLKAGVMDRGRLTPTEEGTPQGGVISPLLLNIALHGMEQAAGVSYYHHPKGELLTKAGCPVLIRYADDMVAICHSREQAQQVCARLEAWLEPRGLAFNQAKTRIVHLDQGFDFLGFNIRRYHGRQALIKPSKDAIRRVRERLRAEMHALRGSNAAAVINTLSAIIRGWAAYYRTQVAKRTFALLDNYVWRLTYKWTCHTHGNKPKGWVITRYFGAFHPSRRDRWVFGDPASTAYLPKFAWTTIVRHTMVAGSASPDDPRLARYWADRRRAATPSGLNAPSLRLLKAQQGRCGHCGGLLHADHPPQSPTSGNSGFVSSDGRSTVTIWTPPRTATRAVPAWCMPSVNVGARLGEHQARHFCTLVRH